ncbi:MAG: cyclopropane-fatty-acyl-phospholipid synthase family protein [Sphingomonadales bacterium]
MYLLSPLLRKIMRHGRLCVIDAGGKRHVFGPDEAGGVTIRFHDRWTPTRLALNPGLALGEAYMDGRMTVEDGHDILDFLDLVLGNMEWSPDSPLHQLGAGPRNIINLLSQYNFFARAKKNVAHHYDLGDELYALFLDKDWQYSCGYFPTGDESLDDAQDAKKRHIAKKLLLKPECHVLDIGCGWGGLALTLNRLSGARVTGITLSDPQHARASARAGQAGVADKVDFQLQDYRKVEGRFDRIVSVGMFEHVGLPYYRTYFEKCRELLADDGVMLLHTIGRADGPGGTNPWMRKYIFPGGYSPSLSEIAPAAEKAGLWITDIEVWRLHYAKTLQHWYDRSNANAAKITALYDARFLRMWQFYLAASLCTFRHLGHVVFQVQLTRRQDAVPLTRGYMGVGGTSAC